MNRLLNRRDKDGNSQRKEKPREKKIRPLSGDFLWWFFRTSPHKKQDQEQEDIVAEIKQKLLNAGHPSPKDDQVHFALGSEYANKDPDRAYEILVLFQESVEGLIRTCDPNIQLEGAINRNNVTCYIDSVLFAMFAGFQSYDRIFFGAFENDAQRILSRMLLLYANMLRAGKLIHTDLTKTLQDALAANGWENSPNDQQDASEFYGFIAQTLNIPLLSMKSKIFHHATPDESHDHRIVEEQVLNVSIPDTEDCQPVPLERCLEGYLNNKVEITRSVPRVYPFSTVRTDIDKELLCRWDTSRSTPSLPISGRPPEIPSKNGLQRCQTMKEIQNENIISQDGGKVKNPYYTREVSRKDVRILAWQFFNILRPPPISLNYTSNKSSNSIPILIGDIAWNKKNKTSTTVIDGVSEIGNSAPALVICLKRYGFKDGHPFRKNTPIDIPEEIFLPHLIDDERVDDYDQTQSYKLVLMAVVCHRGKSLNEGHYTTLVRRAASISIGDSNSARKLSNASQPPHYTKDQWCKFDDLSNPRVFTVNFEDAILAEMPYLLFYQIQPQIKENSVTSDCADSDQDPPSYDSGIALTLTASCQSQSSETKKNGKENEYVAPQSSEVREFDVENGNSRLIDDFTNKKVDDCTNTSGPTAQLLRPKSPTQTSSATEETTKTRLSRAASRFTKGSLRSRPSSQSGESRISATISRMSLMRSKEQLRKAELIKERQNNDELVVSQIPLFINKSNINPANETHDCSKKNRNHKRHRSLGYITRKDHDLHPVEITEEKSKLKDTERDKECKIM
ncbi:putative ubiquitin c-terminal hydrolase family protein [Erysiphe neolycopersici]|uniref:ubiquitinyl hydrolase 1 n=1 Tax=Erysiphe neolycopersici TaxID=212602 RepID=A0A420HYB3_9PEZI|nr:putative ubiquitin c-terminal hydrolase family protein [Erysiphe neolycopersici]